MIHSIDIRTSNHCEFVDITARVEKIIKESSVSEGVCYIYTPHTTGGLTINENRDPSVKKDILRNLSDIAPRDRNYSHAEGNADAHIKSSLVGGEKTLFIENGRLLLGTWQGIFFCEFDGWRKREIWIKITKC